MTPDAMALNRLRALRRALANIPCDDLHIADRTMRRWLASDFGYTEHRRKRLTKLIDRTVEAARRHGRLLRQRGRSNGVSSSFSSLLQIRRCWSIDPAEPPSAC